MEEIGIAKILLGKEIIGLEDEGYTKFFNCMLPVTL
jgi:hypothetical protein